MTEGLDWPSPSFKSIRLCSNTLSTLNLLLRGLSSVAKSSILVMSLSIKFQVQILSACPTKVMMIEDRKTPEVD
ncbi:hypothetical protein VTK56DRAFT_4357 [Thermocarpiscus australiensis]